MKARFRLKGGPGSGHRGHAGRPGQVGGSVSGIRSELSPKEYMRSLSDDQKVAVEGYTASEYQPINKHLRYGMEVSAEVRGAITTLDGIMDEAPPLTNATLYRAVAKSPEEKGMRVGDIFQDRGFVSTTKSARYLHEKLLDLPTRVTIKLPKATRSAVRGIDAHTLSKKKAEQEVLLDRGTRFRVKSIGKQGDYNLVVLEVLPGG